MLKRKKLMLLNASNPVHEMNYLSYQPPGNGWNNQRVALENATALTKLLNTRLSCDQLATNNITRNTTYYTMVWPHDKGVLFKAGAQPGYVSPEAIQPCSLVCLL